MTLDDIKKRCEEVGDCWIWQRTLLRGKTPIMKIDGKSVYPRRVTWQLHNGKDIPDTMVVTHRKTCGDPLCCNPDHLILISRKALVQRTGAEGKFSTARTKAKIAASKRKNSKLSQEAVREIIGSDESMPVLAKKHGISEAYGYMLRRGLFRREVGNPFSGLGAR